MNRAASVLALLGSCAALLAARLHTEHARIDRAFLQQLRTLPVDRSLSEQEESLYGSLVWGHEHALRYLAATGDPDAIACVVRIMARRTPPGACGCSAGAFDACIFGDGAPSAFWESLHLLSPDRQAAVLHAADAVGYSELNAPRPWEANRDEYLAANLAVGHAYRAIAAADEQ